MCAVKAGIARSPYSSWTEALPEEEKRSFTEEFLRRAIPFDSGALNDEETARGADELFAVLDTEENDTSSR